MDWTDTSVMVTGGTGSFGRKFTEGMLKRYPPRKLIVFSRDELKQHQMRMDGFEHENLRYFIGVSGIWTGSDALCTASTWLSTRPP
jgi:UDP-N-acetylglucosamine 4,6-dehydratase/5-epimerase